MPKQKRWDLKRKCDIILKNLNHALYQAQNLYQVYYPDYPEYYPFPELWCQAIDSLIESVSKFREEI
jgi:hypothetical protein